MAKGVVRPPPKAQKKKKKKKKMGFGLLGVAGPPLRTWGWIRPPQKADLGWPNPPPGPWGWSDHPQKAKTHFSFFFFFFFLGYWGWPDHPLGHRGGSTTPRPAVGVAPATPDFFPPPPPPFFLIFSFVFFLFLIIKWPKRRCFEAQNSVVLESETT
jgi:hypothetical protein